MADERGGFGGAGTGALEAEQLWLAWENRIRVLLNPSVWGGVLAAFGM
jgi:hypothetical protein